jgi:predicted nuclease of restriction endonuclease-like (RecB) superfamily
MRLFAVTYTDFEILQQVVGQIPWRHNVILLDKVSSTEKRLWYTQKPIEYGWSHSVLAIYSRLLKNLLYTN